MLWQLLHYGATFLLSLSLALYLTPLIRKAALSFGITDKGDGQLKLQKEPVAYLGGVAVYLSFLISLSVVFDFEPTLMGLLLGATMITMLGLFDDLRVIKPNLKLALQLLSAWVMIRSNISIQLAFIPIALSIPLTLAWLAGVSNSINIIDVSDGLAVGVSGIAAIALFVLAATTGNTLIATATLALAGSLVGFLHYNQPPAKIYLGDTGSLFIGFTLAALAMNGEYTQNTTLGALAPLFILVVPLFDTLLVSLARLKKGLSPMRGTPDHFALRLKHSGWTSRQVSLFAYAFGSAGGCVGLALTQLSHDLALNTIIVATVCVLAIFIWIWRLPVRGDS